MNERKRREPRDRSPCTFRIRDLIQAIKGASAAGVDVRRIEIDRNGKIIMSMARPGEDWDVTLQEGRGELAA